MTQILPPRENVSGWQSRRYRAAALSFAARKAEPGVWVEAGVAEGWSANYLLRRMKPHSQLHLFDSFEGLPEAWGDLPAGTFKTSPPRFDDPRVRVHVGMFDQTFPRFVRSVGPAFVTLLHIDCDLYASAMTVLRELTPMIRPGCIVVFDEAIGSIEAIRNEGRAILDWQRESGLRLREIARTDYTQVVMEVS